MMTSYIIFAFVSGFLLATVIFWIVNRKQHKDWQAEYRRLMGGIDQAMEQNIADDPDGDNPNKTYYILSELLYGG